MDIPVYFTVPLFLVEPEFLCSAIVDLDIVEIPFVEIQVYILPVMSEHPSCLSVYVPVVHRAAGFRSCIGIYPCFKSAGMDIVHYRFQSRRESRGVRDHCPVSVPVAEKAVIDVDIPVPAVA